MAKQSALKVPTGLSPEKQAKVDAILKKYEEQNRQIEREHAKEMAKLYGGAALQIGSAFIPGTLGLKLAGGAIKGLAPIVGRKIAQNVATGVTSGLASGAVEGLGRGLMENQNPLKTMATDSLAGGLLGGLGGYGLGKVAQKLNTQTAWHGSPYKFDRFSNEAIGTGEGAQAHGYGHYAAKNKDVADRYREVLSDKPPLYEEYKSLKDHINLLNALDKKSPLNDTLKNALKESQEKLMNIEKEYIPEYYLPQGNLYKLSIPKDDVMLREDLLLSQQPKFVQQAFKDEIANFKKGLEEELQSNIDAKNILLESLQNAKAKGSDRLIYTIEKDIERNLPVYDTKIWQLQDQLNQNVPAGMNKTGETIYNELGENASNILGSKGIKGISYNGGIDGEANVIFNPDDIDIIPYYDNPTSFKEKFINLLNR